MEAGREPERRRQDPNFSTLFSHVAVRAHSQRCQGSSGCCGEGADPTQCLAGVPARAGALGTQPQPATELPSTESCQCLVIIMQTQLAALLLPFRGRWVRLLSEFLPSWPTTTRSCLYGSPSPCAFLMNLRLMLDFSVSCLITAAVTSSLVGLK